MRIDKYQRGDPLKLKWDDLLFESVYQSIYTEAKRFSIQNKTYKVSIPYPIIDSDFNTRTFYFISLYAKEIVLSAY